MDLMLLGAWIIFSFILISNNITNITESPQDSVFLPSSIDSELEIPCQERLLPIGQHNKDITHLVDKVRQALGINSASSKVIGNQKKVAQAKEVTHSPSPRRLIKQVALESPPHQEIESDMMCKEANANGKSKILVVYKFVYVLHFCLI